MTNYIFPFVISILVSLILTFLVKNYCNKKKLALSEPRARDVHIKPVPRLGGIAVFVTFWLVVFGYCLLNPHKFNFVGEQILGIDKNLMGVFLGSVILFLVGVYDDIKGVNAWVKLFFQVLSGVIIVYFGINIWWFANPLGGANIELGKWTYLFVPIWIVLLINVVNWLDGIDGLASGISGITLLILFFLSISPLVNQSATALVCIILAGAVLGFLPLNFNPAKIFLGDSGSMFLGFMIAIAAIISGGKIATVALILGVPILDAIWVILRRLISGKSPMAADKYHIHHRFLRAGFSQRQTVLFLYAISLIFGLIALQSGTRAKLVAGLWMLAIMVIIGAGLIYINHQKKDRNV